MSDYTAEVELQDHKRGDVWPGILSIGPIMIDESQPSYNLVRVRMYFRTRSGAQFTCDSDASVNPDAPIVIDDAATWQAHVPAVNKFLQLTEPWSWDMEFYGDGPDTAPITLFKGVITVNPDTSR